MQRYLHKKQKKTKTKSKRLPKSRQPPLPRPQQLSKPMAITEKKCGFSKKNAELKRSSLIVTHRKKSKYKVYQASWCNKVIISLFQTLWLLRIFEYCL